MATPPLDNHDKDLLELLVALDGFNPIIPEALLDYYFTKAGLQCDDARLKKLVALVAQKFVTDLAGDALAHQRLRVNSARTTSTGTGPTTSGGKRTVLTTEDLSAALAERGIRIEKPFYHI